MQKDEAMAMCVVSLDGKDLGGHERKGYAGEET
jgi:hypothetical protein